MTKADATAPESPERPAASLYVDGGPPKVVSATPPKPVAQEKPPGDPREVRFGGLSLVAPQGWSRQPLPLQSIGVAEFSLRRSQGDPEDAQLTVTLFVKDDPKGLARLRDQLKEEEQARESTVQDLTLGGREVVIVDSTEEADEVADSRRSSASKRRYRSLNAMVFLGNTVYSVQCTGPEKTVAERLGEFRAFLETMKAVE